MAVIQSAKDVPRGHAGLAAWLTLGSSSSSLTWGYRGAALGRAAGGWVALLAGGERVTVLVVTGELGLDGGAAVWGFATIC